MDVSRIRPAGAEGPQLRCRELLDTMAHFHGRTDRIRKKEGADYVYHDKWLPQVFKLILGGVLGLLTTPLMAMFWLIKAGWEYKKEEETTPVIAEV